MFMPVHLFLGANIEGILSKELKPDEFFVDIINHKVYILEKKFQSTDGSTDEKLETCDFFKDEKYTDVVKYIKSVGCQICFSKIPFEFFNLPKII